MPLYEYICRDCGKKFEELLFVQEPKVNCPACKSANVEKLLSVFSASSASSSASSMSSSAPSCACGKSSGFK